MAKNIIFLTKKRSLAGIDQALPIFMEMRKISPQSNIIIVFGDKKIYDLTKRNYILLEDIEYVNGKMYVLRGKNKLITLFKILKFVFLLAFKENIILRETDNLPWHNITMKLIKMISRVVQIRVFLAVQNPIYLKNLNESSLLYWKREGKAVFKNPVKGEFDYFLSALSPGQVEDVFNVKAPRNKIVEVGYTHGLSIWRKYMDDAIKRNKVINNGKYFLYVLAYLGKRRTNFDEPEIIDLLEESLNILKKYNGKIKTIFKPHPVTDMGRVKKLLDKISYSNYVIDYTHPFILSSKAQFVFGNVYSCTMLDAYYQGKPIVEYCQYDSELFIRMNRQSWGGSRFCDFFIYRDKKKLDEVLDRLINNEIKVEREPKFMQDNFPDTPPQFYEFLHKLLS
ncbi:MAG: hypothetical protein V1883_03260 [Candidatus Omnitrophota bacterium]